MGLRPMIEFPVRAAILEISCFPDVILGANRYKLEKEGCWIVQVKGSDPRGPQTSERYELSTVVMTSQ